MLSDQAVDAAVEAGFLDLERHSALLDRIDHWARVAGINPIDVLTGMSESCGEDERTWFRRSLLLAEEGECVGMIYLGYPDEGLPKVSQRMRALAAGYLRNYKDARIVSREEMADNADATVLLVSDFATRPTDYLAKLTAAALLSRSAAHLPTVLHLPKLEVVENWYGEAVEALIRQSYVGVHFG